MYYPLLAGVLAAVPLMGAARFFGRPSAATAVALVYVLFRSSALLVVWAMGSYDHLTPPVFVLAPALAIDLGVRIVTGASAKFGTVSSPHRRHQTYGWRWAFQYSTARETASSICSQVSKKRPLMARDLSVFHQGSMRLR